MANKRAEILPECKEQKQLCFAITGEKYCTILRDTNFYDKRTGLPVKCPFYQNMNTIYLKAKKDLQRGRK